MQRDLTSSRAVLSPPHRLGGIGGSGPFWPDERPMNTKCRTLKAENLTEP